MSCKNCKYLKKSHKEFSRYGEGFYRYECSYKDNEDEEITTRYIVGWCGSDNDLSNMGCSNEEKRY